MKPSERYAYARLARELAAAQRQDWLDADAPSWDWPLNHQRRGFWKSALFAIRYGSGLRGYRTLDEQRQLIVAGKALAALRRRMGD